MEITLLGSLVSISSQFLYCDLAYPKLHLAPYPQVHAYTYTHTHTHTHTHTQATSLPVWNIRQRFLIHLVSTSASHLHIPQVSNPNVPLPWGAQFWP